MAVTERNHLPEQERARHFHHHLLADVYYLNSRGYKPGRLLGMIAREGSALAPAKRLFSDPRLTFHGFERLWEMRELGRSAEFVANLPWFRDLFTENEPDEARSRLALHEFPAEERLAGRHRAPSGHPSRRRDRCSCADRRVPSTESAGAPRLGARSAPQSAS